MAKYVFNIVFDRELSHEEINELELALWSQCERYDCAVAQLIKVEQKKDKCKCSHPCQDNKSNG